MTLRVVLRRGQHEAALARTSSGGYRVTVRAVLGHPALAIGAMSFATVQDAMGWAQRQLDKLKQEEAAHG
jgi:hypothetical protein